MQPPRHSQHHEEPNLCPCGSGSRYTQCCRLYHSGGELAPTPEALMRSRYSAFALKVEPYLINTWDGSTRPAQLDLESSPEWVALQILRSDQQGDSGKVHFRAVHRLADGFGFLEEESDFVRKEGAWYYTTGKTREGRLRPGRNDRCPCGSGRKYKVCCCP